MQIDGDVDLLREREEGDERKNGGSIVELKGEARPVERSLSCAAHGALLVVAPISISL